MTKLTKNLTREVHSPRFGALVITLTPTYMELREKGRRTRYQLTYGVAFQQAVAAAVNAAREDRQKQKRSTARGLLRRVS